MRLEPSKEEAHLLLLMMIQKKRTPRGGGARKARNTPNTARRSSTGRTGSYRRLTQPIRCLGRYYVTAPGQRAAQSCTGSQFCRTGSKPEARAYRAQGSVLSFCKVFEDHMLALFWALFVNWHTRLTLPEVITHKSLQRDVLNS